MRGGETKGRAGGREGGKGGAVGVSVRARNNKIKKEKRKRVKQKRVGKAKKKKHYNRVGTTSALLLSFISPPPHPRGKRET